MNSQEKNLLELTKSNIYVVDVENYNFVYYNDNVKKLIAKSKKLLNIPKDEEVKCYTAVYGYDKPCDFCKIGKFKTKEEIIEFEAFNNLENKWFNIRENLIHSSNGRIAKYSVGNDVTEFKTIQRDLTTHYAELLVAKEEIKTLNKDLSKKVKEEVEKNRQKDKQLMEQSKMAQMGEMIANIAHQWRQPLTAISISASGIQLEKEIGILEDEQLKNATDNIVERAEFLSQTIEDFRNFFKTDNKYEEINMEEALNSAVSIVDATFKFHNIEIIKDFDLENPTSAYAIKGELSQVFINILSNAKDILIEKNIEEKQIKIKIKKLKDIIRIEMEDNAGGIPDDVLPKIFDPYFTTKHKSQGAGIGLHMSYDMIVKHMHGKLYAKNSKVGAVFFVEIPIHKK